MATKSAVLAEQLYNAISDDQPVGRIEALVKAGADLEARVGSNGYTALLWALMGDKHVDTAIYLMDAGADPHAYNGLGNALTYAALYGNDRRKLEALLERKVDPNRPDGSGQTALMHCISQGKMWAVDMLLAAGASPYITDPQGSSAIDIARRKQGQDVADDIVAKSIVPPPPPKPITIMKPLVFNKGPRPPGL
jgi:ankyrin repeat protein